MDMKIWLKIIDGKLRRNPVFQALGPDLKAAMVAAEVMAIQRAQHDESAPIEKFNELYAAACRQHIPGFYGDDEGVSPQAR
jgi:hypothetical protein